MNNEHEINTLLQDKPPVKLVLFVVVLVCFITSAFFIFKWGIGLFEKLEQWGQLGDFFGGVLNPTIGLAGIVLLAHTLRQNQKALALTAQELKASNHQLSISASALKCQENLMRQESKTVALTNLLIVFREELTKVRNNQSSAFVTATKIRKNLDGDNFNEIPTLLRTFNYSGNINIRFFSTLAFLIETAEEPDFKTHLYHLLVCYASYEVIAAMYLSSHYTSSRVIVSKKIKTLCKAALIAYDLGPFLERLDEYLAKYPN